MKKIIYFCKHGEAVSDWNITSEVDWICSLELPKSAYHHDTKYRKHIAIDVRLNGLSGFNTDKKPTFYYSTHLIIDEIRTRIAEGVLKSDDVEVYVEDSSGKLHLKRFNEHGMTNDWFDTEDVLDDIFDRLFSI